MFSSSTLMTLRPAAPEPANVKRRHMRQQKLVQLENSLGDVGAEQIGGTQSRTSPPRPNSPNELPASVSPRSEGLTPASFAPTPPRQRHPHRRRDQQFSAHQSAAPLEMNTSTPSINLTASVENVQSSGNSGATQYPNTYTVTEAQQHVVLPDTRRARNAASAAQRRPHHTGEQQQQQQQQQQPSVKQKDSIHFSQGGVTKRQDSTEHLRVEALTPSETKISTFTAIPALAKSSTAHNDNYRGIAAKTGAKGQHITVLTHKTRNNTTNGATEAPNNITTGTHTSRDAAKNGVSETSRASPSKRHESPHRHAASRIPEPARRNSPITTQLTEPHKLHRSAAKTTEAPAKPAEPPLRNSPKRTESPRRRDSPHLSLATLESEPPPVPPPLQQWTGDRRSPAKANVEVKQTRSPRSPRRDHLLEQRMESRVESCLTKNVEQRPVGARTNDGSTKGLLVESRGREVVTASLPAPVVTAPLRSSPRRTPPPKSSPKIAPKPHNKVPKLDTERASPLNSSTSASPIQFVDKPLSNTSSPLRSAAVSPALRQISKSPEDKLKPLKVDQIRVEPNEKVLREPLQMEVVSDSGESAQNGDASFLSISPRASEAADARDALVSVEWLATRLQRGTEDLVVLDCSWYLPISKRHSRREFNECHIPTALYFDLEDCCDQISNLPHTLPPAPVFQKYVRALGINKTSRVVVYDTNKVFGLFSAPRVWWMFRAMGHDNVAVLDGGFAAWCSADFSTTDQIRKRPAGDFNATFREDLYARREQVEAAVKSETAQLIDARPRGRFDGISPEPVPGIKSGHINGAINVPHGEIMQDKLLVKSTDKLEDLFQKAGVSLDKDIVIMCGTGMTSCTLALALHLCGCLDVPVYDGGWTEWVVKSPAGYLMAF